LVGLAQWMHLHNIWSLGDTCSSFAPEAVKGSYLMVLVVDVKSVVLGTEVRLQQQLMLHCGQPCLQVEGIPC
jgi:hypothetical protein